MWYQQSATKSVELGLKGRYHMETTVNNGVALLSLEAKRDSEIREKPTRRRFTMEEKRRIVSAADACSPGTLGALLRQEGIYSSHLAAWRKERDRGNFDAESLRVRSSRITADQALSRRNEELERENRKLHRRIKRAELILDIQKKAAGLLGIELESPGYNEND